MSKYAITSGTIAAPVKTVLYGPEGIGKSTFAAQFPAPVFIDTEGSTKRMNVARLPAPTSWAMLLDEVAEVSRGNVPCGTLVIDTADWAERLCIDAVCARAKVNGIEDFGYGKGYTYVKEEFGKLLDALESGQAAYDFVEIMACPGGCVGGGGQPIVFNQEMHAERAKVLNKLDGADTLRYSHENPDIKKLYDEWVGKPLSETAEEWLHTHQKDWDI